MREQEFRAWLEARRWNGKPLTSISSRMSKARRFEKAMPALGLGAADLDQAFEDDGMEQVTVRVRELCRTALQTGAAPAELVGETTSASRRINNVAAAVRNYRQFREAQVAPASDWPELEELRERFLDRVPAFERFDLTDNDYERVERAYKDVMVAKVSEIASSVDDDEEAGRRIYQTLTPSDGPPLRWETADAIKKKTPQIEGQFYRTVGLLARDDAPVIDSITGAASALWNARQQGAYVLTVGEVAAISITIAGIARPKLAAPFKITKARELSKLLTGDVIFAGDTLEHDQVRRWLDLLSRIETVMRDQWKWAPRDLIDVQGFAWTALDQTWNLNDDDDEALLERFEGNALFRALQEAWTPEQTAAFCTIARAVHDAGLDWYHTNMPQNPVRLGRKPDREKRAIATLGYLRRESTPRIWFSDSEGRPQIGQNAFPLDRPSAEKFVEMVQLNSSQIAAWSPPTPPRRARWPDEAGFDQADSASDTEEREKNIMNYQTTNLILYGPPGTGKTYASAAHAVRLCDGLAEDDPMFAPEQRTELMKRFHALNECKRIEFVTFHQSMAYEEFVEGLRPTTGASSSDGSDGEDATSGGFRLKPRDGILKQISERARLSNASGQTHHLDRSRNMFKIALGRRGSEEDQIEEGLARGLIHLGWGGEVDWSDERFDTFEAIKREWQDKVDADATGKDPNIEMMYTFRGAMQPDDYVILSDGRDRVRGVARVTGEYFYDAAANYHPHRREVQWLWSDADGVSRERFYARQFRRHSTYQLVDEAIDWDALDTIVYGEAAAASGDGEPFVLVIDEINRANISKVFGELITLLEADKRLGAANELKVRLPYSGDLFGVPANLHVIGTMNTADRSIALIDKALRRRFTFTEMMPDYTVKGMADEVADAGVSLADVLRTINDRIEYFLDREHQIGHGWLLGCGKKEELDAAMKTKVIPLIAEYFFEDWGRTADVLGGSASNPFLKARTLASPPGMSGEETRIRWSVRDSFAADAYIRLVTGD